MTREKRALLDAWLLTEEGRPYLERINDSFAIQDPGRMELAVDTSWDIAEAAFDRRKV